MSGHTPGPWQVARMTIGDRVPTPEEIGEYVKNSVLKSAEESGTTDFLFVWCEDSNGTLDICHVGNGPNGPANALLIAVAPTMLAALENCQQRIADYMLTVPMDSSQPTPTTLVELGAAAIDARAAIDKAKPPT